MGSDSIDLTDLSKLNYYSGIDAFNIESSGRQTIHVITRIEDNVAVY